MKEVRRNQGQFRATIFWRDVREVGVAAFLTWLFLHWGIRDHDWSLDLVAFGCFFVGAFIVVDRLIQHQHRPVMNDSLHACIESSLHQVNHQIWLLKNVFWWYLLPIETRPRRFHREASVAGTPCRTANDDRLAGLCVVLRRNVLGHLLAEPVRRAEKFGTAPAGTGNAAGRNRNRDRQI